MFYAELDKAIKALERIAFAFERMAVSLEEIAAVTIAQAKTDTKGKKQ